MLDITDIKSRLAIRVLNYSRPHIEAERLNDVANTLLWLATTYCSCCCVNCRCSAGSVNIINWLTSCTSEPTVLGLSAHHLLMIHTCLIIWFADVIQTFRILYGAYSSSTLLWLIYSRRYTCGFVLDLLIVISIKCICLIYAWMLNLW